MAGAIGRVGGGGPADMPVEVPHWQRQELTRAIMGGDAARLDALLKGVADVNAVLTAHIDRGVSLGNYEGFSLLQLAAIEGQEECVRVLLERGARVELPPRERWDAQMWGVTSPEQSQKRLSAVHLAALFGRGDCLRLMLERMPPEDRAAVVNHREETSFWIEGLRSNQNALTPLQAACVGGHPDCAQALLEFGGARVDERSNTGETALHYAVRNGSEECMGVVLRWGAAFDAQNNQRETPLYLAGREGKVGCLEYLLERGADATIPSEGGTVLGCAARYGADACVRALLRHGVNPNGKVLQGSPLKTAAWMGEGKSVCALLEGGAQKDEKSSRFAESRALASFIDNWDRPPSLQRLCGRVVRDAELDIKPLPPALSRWVRHLDAPECLVIPVDARERREEERSQVYYATRANHPECVGELLRLNPESPYDVLPEALDSRTVLLSPMELAARKGYLECLRILLAESRHPEGAEARCREVQRALTQAVVYRQYKCARALLEEGVEFDRLDFQADGLYNLIRRTDPHMFALLRFYDKTRPVFKGKLREDQ